jgi:hypothetical protein
MNINFRKYSKVLANVSLFAPLALAILCGCSKSAPPAPKVNDFFVSWFGEHGESNIVVDAEGIGVAGNPTRVGCSLYQFQETNDDVTAELEFTVHLPDQREIVEFVSCSGDTLKKAEDDAVLNFGLTTFHVVYRAVINTNDPHQREETVAIGGQPRALVIGDTLARAQSTNDTPNLFPMRDEIRKALAPLTLSPETHWIKIVYANHHSEAVICAVTLDNKNNPALTESVEKLAWPKQEAFYMAKQFIFVK